MATTSPEPLALNGEEQLVYERLADCFDEERKRIAKLMADKDDSNRLGQTGMILEKSPQLAAYFRDAHTP